MGAIRRGERRSQKRPREREGYWRGDRSLSNQIVSIDWYRAAVSSLMYIIRSRRSFLTQIEFLMPIMTMKLKTTPSNIREPSKPFQSFEIYEFN